MLEEIDLSRRLQQGDLIRSKSTVPWRGLGVVVTADCDITNNKHWGTISVVPVETIPRLCSTLMARAWLEKNRIPLIDAFRAKYSFAGIGGQISKDHAELLISSRTKGLPAACESIANALNALESEDYPVDMWASALACNELLPRPVDLQKWLETKARDLPGDLMAIPIRGDLAREFGVAWLRTLRELRLGQIASTSPEWEEDGWIRVGRLPPEYRYRLTQRLASVFADIGLPGELEKACQEAFSQQISRLIKGHL